MGVKSSGVLDCECQSEQTEGDGLERRKRKSARTEKGRACDGLLWIFSRLLCSICVIVAFDSPLDVSVSTSKESRHQPFTPHYICFGIASGIELGQIHYTVAMETKAQMLIKCVRVCVFFSRQIDSMKQTACMHATFRADWQQNFLCVCLSWKVWLRLGMLK